MKDNKKSDNQTHYMPIGLSIGMCIGALIDAQNRKKAMSDSQSEMEETE